MNLNALASEIRNLDSSLAQRAASAVNASLSIRNWLIGAHIVEFEQNGEERAEYGEKLIPELAKRLEIRGLSATMLRHCRTFYSLYPAIHQSLTGEFPKLIEINDLPKSATLSHILESPPKDALSPIRQSLTDESSSTLPRARSAEILTQQQSAVL